jgi:hypothetical protein
MVFNTATRTPKYLTTMLTALVKMCQLRRRRRRAPLPQCPPRYAAKTTAPTAAV